MSSKKYTFAQLEALIKQARQAKKKREIQRWKKLYREKLTNWNKAWKLGQERLIAKQKAKRAKKEAQIRVKKAQEVSRLHRQKRLKEIYDYFWRQLWQEKNTNSLSGVNKQERDYLTTSLYKSEKLTRVEHQQILRKTNWAYQEEVSEKKFQLLYYKDKIGSLNPNKREFLKSEQFKYFFPEKGEHKELFRRRKEFIAEREKILTEFKGQRVKNLEQLLEIYKSLYQKSPWRIRDRFLITTKHPGVSHGMGEVFNKYWKNNTDYPFSYSRKYYLRAIGEMLKKTKPEGEVVPDSEIDFDKYGKPRFKEGQVIVLGSSKPGRNWSVYKNVTSLEKRFEKEIHFRAHESYMKEHGSELEKDIFFNRRKKPFLCVIEAMGFDCRANQGTSEPWCFFCIQWGNPYHPPVLPVHCPWRYTFKTGMCGMVEHREANKQWHWSLQGGKTNVAGKDWGSCHVGRYDHKKRSKH